MSYLATGDANERIVAFDVPMTVQSNFTMMCWIRTDGALERGRIFNIGRDQNVGGGEGYALAIGSTNDSTDGNNLYVVFDGAAAVSSDQAIGTDGWHHLCLVDRAGSQFVYIDGLIRASNNVADPIAPASNVIVGDVVATAPNSSQSMSADQRVANCKAWSRALGTAEVQIEMNSSFPVFYDNLTMFWSLEKSGGFGTANAVDFTQKFSAIGQAQNAPSFADNPPIARC